MASTHLVHLRLVRAFRGYRAGELIQATAGLAETLISQGVAQRADQTAGLFEHRTERAVAGPMAETRSQTYAD